MRTGAHRPAAPRPKPCVHALTCLPRVWAEPTPDFSPAGSTGVAGGRVQGNATWDREWSSSRLSPSLDAGSVLKRPQPLSPVHRISFYRSRLITTNRWSLGGKRPQPLCRQIQLPWEQPVGFPSGSGELPPRRLCTRQETRLSGVGAVPPRCPDLGGEHCRRPLQEPPVQASGFTGGGPGAQHGRGVRLRSHS